MPRIPYTPSSVQRCILAASLTLSLAASAQVVTVDSKPVVGSSNPATAEPPVTRPTSAPCTVTLFDNQVFKDYSAKPISYTPPANCRGHWGKGRANGRFHRYARSTV